MDSLRDRRRRQSGHTKRSAPPRPASSLAAAQAGAPIGDRGQSLRSVAGITDWAARTGRLVSQPQPGDLILFGTRHVGIVQSVNPDGSLTTVEGNASNAVSVEHHSPSEATGFVRL